MSILGTLKVMLTADTGQLSKEMRRGKQEVSFFQREISSMGKSLAGAFTAGAVVTGIKNMIDNTAEYAKQVEDLSRNLGVNTEEASKLIQVTDDLEISQSALEMGMKTALRQGITPNIEGIKDLAAQYQALRTPAEKAAFALKTFGKNGLEMQKILEKTPEQIQEMADALEGSSLIMSEESVQAAKDYRLKLDELNDSWSELSVTVGTKAIPKVTDFMNLMIELTSLDTETWFEDGADASANFINSFFGLKDPLMEVSSSLQVGMGDLRAYEAGLNDVSGAADGAAEANSRVAMSIQEITKTSAAKDALEVLTKAYQDGTIEQENYNVAASDIMRNWLKMPEAQVTGSIAIQNIKEDLNDGRITAMRAADEILGVGNAVERLNGKTAYIDIITRYATVGTPTTSPKDVTTPKKRASGGPVNIGAAYLIGEQGPELFVPQQSGQVVSNQDLKSAMSASNDALIAAIMATRLNTKQLARDIRDALLKVM
jgi:uncharacterized cupredoxin-like copper-binding protein